MGLADENRLEDFIKPCIQTDLLYQRASHGSCAEASQVAGLPSRLKQINDLCCTQEGQNVRKEGAKPGSVRGSAEPRPAAALLVAIPNGMKHF